MKRILFLIAIITFSSINIFSQTIPKLISYQGVLKDASGNIVTGDFPMKFKIYNDPTGGSALWTEIQAVAVANGLFSIQLGSINPITTVPFDRIHYLGITVGTGSELTPRTLLSPSPYSFMTMNVMDNAITSNKIQDGAVTSEKIGSNEVVKSLNGLKDAVNLVAGANITLTPSGNDLTISSAPGSAGVTQVNTGSGLTGGPITTTGTISVANDGITNTMLENNSVTSNKIKDGTIETNDISDASITPIKIAPSSSDEYVLTTSSGNVVWQMPTSVAHNHIGEIWDASIGWSSGALKITNTLNGPSIWGVNTGGGNAIRGDGFGSNSIGVYGGTDDGPGVSGGSVNGNGIQGWSTYGTAIYANGNFVATGTKSAEVKLNNGTPIRLFSEEATEVIFSDYGAGTLKNGKTHIELDPVFLQTVTINTQNPLKVFVQLEGDCNGAFVTNKTNTGFDVVELNNGTSNVSFSYRIVCKRKYFENERMATKEEDNKSNKLMMELIWPEVIDKQKTEWNKMRNRQIQLKLDK